MKILTKAFHEPQGLLYHGGAIIYGVGGYVLPNKVLRLRAIG